MRRWSQRSSLLSDGFFSNELIRYDFKKVGKVPVKKERLTMERNCREISLAIFFRTVVEMRSRLQCELGDLES